MKKFDADKKVFNLPIFQCLHIAGWNTVSLACSQFLVLSGGRTEDKCNLSPMGGAGSDGMKYIRTEVCAKIVMG